MSTHEKYFKTENLGLAAFFVSIGEPLLCTEIKDSRKVLFIFENQARFGELVTSYYAETGQAAAKKLFDNYRSLRALCFARTDNRT